MIHALWHGAAMCGADTPSTWPEGTRWVGRNDVENLGEVNCPGCRFALGRDANSPEDCDDDLVVRLRHDAAGALVASVPCDDKDCDGDRELAEVEPPGGYPDPRLCEHLERTCRNCGRGLAHDEPCAMPPAEADRFDDDCDDKPDAPCWPCTVGVCAWHGDDLATRDDCDGDSRTGFLAAILDEARALPADGSTTATTTTPRWWRMEADGKLADTTEPPPVAPDYWPDDVRCRCLTIPIVEVLADGVSEAHARVLVEAGVREAFREIGHRRADVSALVDRVIARLLPSDGATS